MKKITLMMVAVTSLLAAYSCRMEMGNSVTKPEEEGTTVDGVYFKAVYNQIDTKTILNEGGRVTWSRNDAISIYDGTGAAGWNDGYTIDKRYQNTSGPGETAIFKASTAEDLVAEGAAKYCALCPRNSTSSCDVTNSVFDFWLIDCQKGNLNTFSDDRTIAGRHLNYSVAETTDPENIPLVFHNALSHLKITVPEYLDGKVTHIAIIPLGGEYLAGDTEVTLRADGTVETLGRYEWQSNGTGSKYPAVYLFPDYNSSRYTISGATFEAGTYYAAIRNVSLSKGLLIEYRTTASGAAATTTSPYGGAATMKDVVATQRTEKQVTITTGHIYNMGVVGGKPASAPSGIGVKSFPYSFSFYCNTQNNEDSKYITKGNLSEKSVTQGTGVYKDYAFRQYSGVAATEKDETIGAEWSLSALTYYKRGSTEKTATPQFNYWAQNQGHDNMNTGDFCNAMSVPGMPFECGEYLKIPLQVDVPSSFNISFGLYYAGSWGLKDWAVYYSNDGTSWIKAGNTIELSDVGVSGKNYIYYQVSVENSPISLKKGGVLFVKVVPVGQDSVSGNGCDGFGAGTSNNGRIRFHSSITISDVEVAKAIPVSGAALFQGFDTFNGGLDYMIGDRLAGMANFCGSEASLSEYTLSNIYQRPGYAQIGYVDSQRMTNDKDMTTTNLLGSLKTPAIGAAGDYTLTFKACIYKSPAVRENAGTANTNTDAVTPDITTIRVNVIGGGTINGAETCDISEVTTDSWKDISLQIVGATSSTQIEFTSPTDGLFHRWFIDDICIK